MLEIKNVGCDPGTQHDLGQPSYHGRRHHFLSQVDNLTRDEHRLMLCLDPFGVVCLHRALLSDSIKFLLIESLLNNIIESIQVD